MELTNEQLKMLLYGANLPNLNTFDEVAREASEKKVPLRDYIVTSGLVEDEQLGQIIANYFNFDYIDLKKKKVDRDVLQLIPEVVARSMGVIAFGRTKDAVLVGMLNPDDLELRHFLEKRVAEDVKPFFITKQSIKEALSKYKGSIKETFETLLAQLNDNTLARDVRDNIAIKVVDMLIQYGYDSKASDIHVEPYRKKIVVRFRIDGVLHDMLEIPKDLSELILTRIKVLMKMRTDEHRAAQDGKFQFETQEETVDVRVSIVPVVGGENIVMRLLSAKSRRFDFTSIGLLGEDVMKVEDAAKKPHGMILVTGPTGSGKTTTIYGILKILNQRDVHISTIEDPVEYDIEGVSQIQVNERTNLTFAKGLRAIVRQDPDIIMVGEIRDEETSSIAVESAMTGHLVLSTLHANDAAATLPRLLDMGIEPFLVASTVNIVIAQRLVRRVCEKCRASYFLTEKEIDQLKREPSIVQIFKRHGHDDLKAMRMYKGLGCNACGNTGYTGRVGIFEVMVLTDLIRDLVVKRAARDALMNTAQKEGMTTMIEDGIRKALRGSTSLEEVMRVTKV